MMSRPIRRLSAVALLLAVATGCESTLVPIEFCVEYATSYSDLGGAYWTSNANREARGIHLMIDPFTGSCVTDYDDFVGEDGCVDVVLDSNCTYQVLAQRTAQVNGVDVTVFDDPINRTLFTDVLHGAFPSPYRPEDSDGSEVYVIPATTAHAQLAVGSHMMWANNMGLGSGLPLEYFDDDCCFANGEIHASTWSKTIIGHETGHGIGFRRDLEQGPQFLYDAFEDGCDGDDVDTDKHALLSKEWQSGSAVEGFADTISAWMWNDPATPDCTYDRHYNSDFDLDGTNDNVNGQSSCEGIPVAGLETYVTARDWLHDVINADDDDVDGIQCEGLSTHRSTQYDWLRYGWDMLHDESVPVEHFVDIYDAANPRSWDPDDNAMTSFGNIAVDDDVIVRWAAAAAGHSVDADGYLAEHINQQTNGQDH